MKRLFLAFLLLVVIASCKTAHKTEIKKIADSSLCEKIFIKTINKIKDSCTFKSYPAMGSDWIYVLSKMKKLLHVDTTTVTMFSCNGDPIFPVLYQKLVLKYPLFMSEELILVDFENQGFIKIVYSPNSCLLWGVTVYTKKNATVSLNDRDSYERATRTFDLILND